MRKILACCVLIACGNAGAGEKNKPFLRTYGEAIPFGGAVQFCASFPQECKAIGTPSRLPATRELFAFLDGINGRVNAEVQHAVEAEEWWSLPVGGKGDCEDYALWKRHLLMQFGLPSGALLISIVRDENGDGHAVLVVRTTIGDFVLDNKTKGVVIWHSLPYQWLQQQSTFDPKIWVMLEPPVTRK